MPYSVKEIYYTLQGEGAQTGRSAIFLRFAGCNLWNGLENGRAKAICRFCDTDFVGTNGINGAKYLNAKELVAVVNGIWPVNKGNKYIVCTGGEPLLQIDNDLIDELHNQNFEIAVETNGTVISPLGLDWICVSPKSGTELKIKKGNELKLVYPQDALSPKDFENLDFEHFYIQPMDSPELDQNIKNAIQFCLNNPKWKLSLQTHKLLKIS